MREVCTRLTGRSGRLPCRVQVPCIHRGSLLFVPVPPQVIRCVVTTRPTTQLPGVQRVPTVPNGDRPRTPSSPFSPVPRTHFRRPKKERVGGETRFSADTNLRRLTSDTHSTRDGPRSETEGPSVTQITRYFLSDLLTTRPEKCEGPSRHYRAPMVLWALLEQTNEGRDRRRGSSPDYRVNRYPNFRVSSLKEVSDSRGKMVFWQRIEKILWINIKQISQNFIRQHDLVRKSCTH